MKKTLLIISLLVCMSGFSQVNIDFENGNYTGWQLGSGTNNNSTLPLSTTVTASPGSVNISASSCGVSTYQSLMTSTTNVDPISSQSLASPLGGNYVARVERACAAQHGSILEQTFTVGMFNTLLNVSSLIIVQAGNGHTIFDIPYFSYDVLDASGNPIPAAAYKTGPMPATGFIAVGASYYRPWTNAIIDLSPYIGQNVTLRFTAAGCTQGGHNGYAYVDASLMPSVSGINQNTKSNLTIYPNPVNNFLHIESAENEVSEYEITDLIGHVVMKNQLLVNETIDVSGFKKGIYIFKTNLNNIPVIKKFVKD